MNLFPVNPTWRFVLSRFATVKYNAPNDHNVDVVFMHLTNYSLNKYSQSYVPEPEGSKRWVSISEWAVRTVELNFWLPFFLLENFPQFMDTF